MSRNSKKIIRVNDRVSISTLFMPKQHLQGTVLEVREGKAFDFITVLWDDHRIVEMLSTDLAVRGNAMIAAIA